MQHTIFKVNPLQKLILLHSTNVPVKCQYKQLLQHSIHIFELSPDPPHENQVHIVSRHNFSVITFNIPYNYK